MCVTATDTYLSTEELKEVLSRELSKRAVRVLFRKRDGSTRDMICSLRQDDVIRVLKKTAKKTSRTREPNPDVCVVVDLEKDEFRSFRWDSVIAFEKE